MPKFDYSFIVRAPLVAVAEFHRDTFALQVLTPPPVRVQIHSVEALAEGSISDFTLWFGPLPIRWVAQHSNVDAQRGFTDTQTSGPMAKWVHTHSFTTEEGSETVSRVTEHIEYEHSASIRGILTRLLFTPVGLRMMFSYRRLVTRRLLETKDADMNRR